jgi:hypothetical protein
MKKIVFFIAVAFVVQVFNMNAFCQTINGTLFNINSSNGEAIGHLTSSEEKLVLFTNDNDFVIDNGIDLLLELKQKGTTTVLNFPLWPLSGEIIQFNAGGSFSFSTNNLIELFIHNSGNVGIGTANPSAKLNVVGDVKLENSIFNISDKRGINLNVDWIQFSTGSDTVYYKGVKTTTNNGMAFGVNNKYVMDIEPNNGKGYVMIYKDGAGVHPSKISNYNKDKYALFVEEGILSEDYAIGPQSSWADHVFKTDYKLQTLNEVENYIKTNNRLPDMPSATDVKENGYTLHDMNVKLLQKVEELTLYSIEQNKKIEELENIAKSYQTLLERMETMESKINK